MSISNTKLDSSVPSFNYLQCERESNNKLMEVKWHNLSDTKNENLFLMAAGLNYAAEFYMEQSWSIDYCLLEPKLTTSKVVAFSMSDQSEELKSMWITPLFQTKPKPKKLDAVLPDQLERV